jgi:hypothetical protein
MDTCRASSAEENSREVSRVEVLLCAETRCWQKRVEGSGLSWRRSRMRDGGKERQPRRAACVGHRRTLPTGTSIDTKHAFCGASPVTAWMNSQCDTISSRVDSANFSCRSSSNQASTRSAS